MKGKLYYQDQYIREFQSNLVSQQKSEDGRWFAVLEETAFYPAGGGQPSDTGMLNNVKVTEVEEMDGIIRHYLEGPIADEGPITGMINWNRRFDHMQQHSGQHILSAAFVESLGYETVSFHLGKETSTIDLNTSDLTEGERLKAEALANEIILQNLPIHTKWVNKYEAGKYPLRKRLAVEEDIRLVIIPEFDYNGCGGTHPGSTGEVGLIKILGWEKQRKNTRVSFVCGQRVAKQLHEKNHILKQLTGVVNAPPSEMVSSVKTLIENGKKNEKLLEEARQTILSYEAEALGNSAVDIHGTKVVKKVLQHRSMAEMQQMARSVLQRHGAVVLLVSENGDKLQFVFGAAPSCHNDMKELVSYALEITNGKGGGNSSLAQGGGSAVMPGEELLNRLMEQL
ncbi:alanyl-tRNA editing protein [Bacillus salacetis]|uniref:Alanine--tRNA ligase n=1 Tax=Bacillus salacetis TaxID=2315464 RepID=A0A3A1RC03_9BACI|nr:DHHA1 domain-containing protein [Bacillus salacetis]RIW38463.1 alanyl-tRNA editing protein [Bacillus salacetis]